MAYDGKLLQRGMRCLIDNLGIIETEKFIALFTQEQIPDYTQWQRDYFDSMTPEEFNTSLEEFIRNHPDDSYDNQTFSSSTK